jgi:hypothetical protein
LNEKQTVAIGGLAVTLFLALFLHGYFLVRNRSGNERRREIEI